jgi:hypothetical protein
MAHCTDCNQIDNICQCTTASFHGAKLFVELGNNSISLEDFCSFLNKETKTENFSSNINMAHIIVKMFDNGIYDTPTGIVKRYLKQKKENSFTSKVLQVWDLNS